MAKDHKVRRFFFPPFTIKFLIRVSVVALVAYLFFDRICVPIRIEGSSMEPTYCSGGVNFCWRLNYTFAKPKRFDVVAVRLAGRKVMLLKRVIALEGESVEFREGKLLVDGQGIDEPYLRYPCTWNLSARRVDPGCVYVVGDNRKMPIENHYFGQTPMRRIMGVPLW